MTWRNVGLILFAIFSLNSCASKPFLWAPPPDALERWKKSGATNTDIAKALLECGFPSPQGRFYYKNNNGEQAEVYVTSNDVVQSRRCMESNGFVSDNDNSLKFCQELRSKNLPACLPNAPVPMRDLNKRINSQFCHEFPKANACSP